MKEVWDVLFGEVEYWVLNSICSVGDGFLYRCGEGLPERVGFVGNAYRDVFSVSKIVSDPVIESFNLDLKFTFYVFETEFI